METIQMPPELKQPGISDGSELVPATVGTQAQQSGHDPANPPAPPLPNGSATQLPPGATVDQEGLLNNYPVVPDMHVQQAARFGWTPYAERWNGRLAMLGFGLLLATELISGQSLVTLWANLG